MDRVHEKISQCRVCNRSDARSVTTQRHLLYPDAQGTEAFETFIIYQCEVCSHVYADTGHSDDWLVTLYGKELEREIWSLDGEEPYDDVIDFCLDFLEQKKTPSDMIVDFGCGRGTLLERLHDRYPSHSVIGVDFRNNLKIDLPFVEADLTRLNEIDQNNALEYSIGFCMHVLEHLPDPVQFLVDLRKLADNNSFLYLEVPDHDALTEEILVSSNLWSPQHIHFFSMGSLSRAVQLAGWTIIREEQSLFGFVPRLRMILKPADLSKAARNTEIAEQVLFSIRKNAATIICEMAKDNIVNIWGIGSEFRFMLEASSNLRTLLQEGKLALFDQDLAGTRFEEHEIHSPEELTNVSGSVVITARPQNTRKRMRDFALKQGFADKTCELWGEHAPEITTS